MLLRAPAPPLGAAAAAGRAALLGAAGVRAPRCPQPRPRCARAGVADSGGGVSSGKRETDFYSSRGNCILKLFGPPVGLRYDQASRHSLAGPISATSGDAKANTIKTDDSKRDLYISFAVCLAVKMYYTLQDKLPGLVDTKSLMSEKYVSLAVTMFSLIKAIYEALKMAKEIRELIKYYHLKKDQAN